MAGFTKEQMYNFNLLKSNNPTQYGDLGVALSGNYGFLAFLRDFDKYYAKLFDGARHDSGDPIKWGELLTAHYKRLGIDPTTKSIITDMACSLVSAVNRFKKNH